MATENNNGNGNNGSQANGNNNGNNGNNGQPNNGGQQQPQPEAAPKRGWGKILLTAGGIIVGAGAVLLICRKKIFGD